MSEPILEMKNISKNFGSVIALKNVDLEVYPGEIRGLIGENGSGKSTISSIAAGMQKATSGRMTFKKQSWEPASMIDALQNGIGMVVQESGTISGVTVAENIFLAELSQFRNKLGMINKKAMNQKATEAMRAIGVEHVIGDMPIDSLDFQTRKLVEIAKVMLKNPDILVIDETSTALSQDGREIMYSLIRKLRDSGKAIIFISHDLEEIMEVCDTLTVLRDGNLIRTFKKEEFNADEIRTSMIGRELQGDYYRSDFTPSSQKEAAITATNLKYKEELKSVSITLKKRRNLRHWRTCRLRNAHFGKSHVRRTCPGRGRSNHLRWNEDQQSPHRSCKQDWLCVKGQGCGIPLSVRKYPGQHCSWRNGKICRKRIPYNK